LAFVSLLPDLWLLKYPTQFSIRYDKIVKKSPQKEKWKGRGPEMEWRTKGRSNFANTKSVAYYMGHRPELPREI